MRTFLSTIAFSCSVMFGISPVVLGVVALGCNGSSEHATPDALATMEAQIENPDKPPISEKDPPDEPPCHATCALKACGADNGCGGTCYYGSCPSGQTCGGGGTPGVCACRPQCSAQQTTGWDYQDEGPCP